MTASKRKRRPIFATVKRAASPVAVRDPLDGVDPRLRAIARRRIAGRWAEVRFVDVTRTRVEFVLPNPGRADR